MRSGLSLTRRRFLGASLAGLGCAACAGPLTEPAPPARPASATGSKGYGGLLMDAHSHAGRQHGYDEDELLRVMDAAGVRRVVVFGAAPTSRSDSPVLPVAYVQGEPRAFRENLGSRLKDGAYRGLKLSVRHFPFPMQPSGIQGNATDRHVRAAAELAAEARRPLTLHLDGPRADDLAALCREFREAPIVWAHGGGTPARFGGGAGAAQVRQMLDAHSNLYVDLSARAPNWMGPLAFGEWEPVLLAHPGRILFGIDVFMGRFFQLVGDAATYWRELLGQLPGAVAEQVAYRNAERLFHA